MDPLIIYAALCSRPFMARPHEPVVPTEITADALACIAAGATIVHTHVDDLNLPTSAMVDRYLEAYLPILALEPGALLLSTAGAFGATIAERFAHYGPLAAAGMRMGILDAGVVNLGRRGADGLPDPAGIGLRNSFADIADIVALLAKHRLGPSVTVYEPGFLRTVLAYHEAGHLPAGTLVKLYFSDHNIYDGRPSNVTFGLPPTPAALDAYLELVEPSGLPWMVAAFGGDIVGSGLAELAIRRGGHVRVGIEDYRGPASPTNEALVRSVAKLADRLGRPIAGQGDTARILGLPER